MSSTVSMREIARRAGVSAATVSRVLSNHPGIAEDTRQLVMRHVGESGYQPNPRLQRHFRSLHGGSKTIAFLSSPVFRLEMDDADSFHARILHALQAAFRQAGFHLLLADTARDLMADGTPYCVAEGVVEGVVAEVENPSIIASITRHLPTVLYNCELRLGRTDAAIPDAERAAAGQVDHLFQLGHRRIACFWLRPGCWQDLRFWGGYELACMRMGIPPPPAYLHPIQFGMHAHPAAIAAFLDRVCATPAPATAILTGDTYATEFVRQLAARGLRVPRDISLIGYDDLQPSLPDALALTSYRQNFEAMAQAAVRLLKDRIANPDAPVQTVEVEGLLVERGTTAPCPTGGA